jgi:hypothetical protein
MAKTRALANGETTLGACARVAAARKVIAAARNRSKPLSCPVALLTASFALADLAHGAANVRKHMRDGHSNCALAVAKGGVEVADLLSEACGRGEGDGNAND